MAFEYFLNWSVGQLQLYLMRRGNKKDLAARALVAFDSNDPLVFWSKDISDWLEREYNSLLSIENPRNLEESVWQSDLAAMGTNILLYSGNNGL